MITLTPRAATELKDLIVSQEKQGSALRVWVAGGGCSGLSYGMALDDQAPEEGDEVYEVDGVKVIIDSLSLGHMDGSSVDFVDDDFGGGFKIDNPKAVGGCGCGNSFQTEETAAAPGGGCGSCSSRG
jgi:iron-sulfur cluster assembly accessory protein